MGWLRRTRAHWALIVSVVGFSVSLPAAAQVGSACPINAINGVNNLANNIETMLYCSGSTWIAAVPQIGSTSASCSSTTAGTLQYTSSTFEGCNGSNWITLGGSSSTVTLGTSAGITNPQRSGDATTGLFSPATGAVSISSGGTEEMRVTSSGVGIGTASPAANLDVWGTIDLNGQIGLKADSQGNGGFLAYAVNNIGQGISGSSNIGLGTNACALDFGGSYNTCVGASADYNISNGSSNTAIGQGACYSNSSGSGDICLGAGANVPSSSTSNFLNIGNIIFATGITGSVSSPAGSVGIGTASPAEPLEIYSSGSGVLLQLAGSSGTCNHTPGSSSETVSCSSDVRLKSGVTDTPSALRWLSSIRVRDFTWKSTGQRRTGVIAQELQETHPEMVTYDKTTDEWTVEQPNPWTLVKILQEQQAEIDDLKRQLAAKR